MTQLILRAAAFCCVAAASIACASSREKILVEVNRPPDGDLLLGVESLAIADFAGPKGEQFTDVLTAAIASNGNVKIVDRKHVADCIKEMKLTHSGLTEIRPDKIYELGHMLNVDAIIYGNVATCKVSDENGTTPKTKYVNEMRYDAYGNAVEVPVAKNIEVPTIRRTGAFDLTFNVTKVVTRQIVAGKPISKKFDQTQEKDPMPTWFDPGQSAPLPPIDLIERNLRDEAAREIVQHILPYKSTEPRNLIITDGAEMGIAFIRGRNYRQAIDVIKSQIEAYALMPQKDPNVLQAYYLNLSVACELIDDFINAENYCGKAVQANGSDMEACSWELAIIQRRKMDMQKLATARP